MRRLTWGLVSLALIVAGCGGGGYSSGGGGGGMTATTAAQDANDAESGLNQATDAATQALLDTATSGTPGDQPGTSLAAATAATMSAVDLHALNLVNATVTFSALHDSAGNPRYPHMSGSFSVSSSGDAVASWPTGAGTMANDTVTITFDQGPVTFSDPSSGATATITSGSITGTLSSDYTYASTQNWHLTMAAGWTVAVGTPLTWSVTRTSGGVYGTTTTHSVVLSGNRHAALDLTRVNNGGSTNTLVIDRTIDGGSGGVSGVDPGSPSQTYTNWVFAIDGTDHDTWNRFAHANVTWDLAPATPTRTVNSLSEKIFITRNGAKTGPYTSLQLLTLYQLLSQD